MNRNFLSSRSLDRSQTGNQVESALDEHANQKATLTCNGVFLAARLRAQQGSLLADILFADPLDPPESEQLPQSKQSQNRVESHSLSVNWLRISALTRVEIGAHLAAMFDEPDGIRLVRAAVGMLEQLGLTTSEDIGEALQMRVPELFAVPLSYPYDDVIVLLRQYLLMTRASTKAEISDALYDSEILVPCGNCGCQWLLVHARSWIHFESFVYGLGCPSCQVNFTEHTPNPDHGRVK